MGKFSGCLLVADIDGTLLYNGQIPARNLEYIEYFKREGGIFTIATGRHVMAAKYCYDLAKANAPVIACQGGVIYDFETQKTLFGAELPKAAHKDFFKIAEKFKTLGLEIHSAEKIYTLRHTARTEWHRVYENLVFDEPPQNLESFSWSKTLFTVDDDETLAQLTEFCKQFEHCRFVLTGKNEREIYFEMVPFGVDKGEACQRLKSIVGAKYVMGIGDFYNDYEMIKKVDFGAVTADAPDELKQIANYVTGPCKDGAVADLIMMAENQQIFERK